MRVCSSEFPSRAGIPRQDYPATRPGSPSPRLGGVGWACFHKNIKSRAQLLLPLNQTELNSFLGMCDVYRRFIKYYAQISKPSTKFTSKKRPHVLPPLDAAHLEAFEYPTERLTSTPILALPRREGLFILDTNSCAFQVGCTRSYNSRPHRTAGEPPMDLVTPRCLSKFSLERMPDGMTRDAGQSVAEAKDAFLE